MTATFPMNRPASTQPARYEGHSTRQGTLALTGRPSAHRTPPPRSGTRLRLTRRGRLVVVLGSLAILLSVGFTVGRVSASSAASVEPKTVVVEAEDTLWSIATHAAPGRDPRTVIADIERLNHLSSAVLVPGVQLVLPT